MSPSASGKTPRESQVVMTQLILPSDANALGGAFGGKVMEWIDVCAAISAQRHCRSVVVTASMEDLHFHAPIKLGWIVTLKARVLATFHTSMEVGVTVTSEDPLTGVTSVATSALLTFVALGPDGKKTPVPPLELETDHDRAACAEAQTRRDERLQRRKRSDTWLRLL
jgi:acyl-CoA hydrolase